MVVEESDPESFKATVGKKFKGIASKLGVGGEEKTADPNLKAFNVQVLVSGIPDGTKEMSTGRKGELVFGSGYKLLKIVINQRGK